jgi:membrane protease subunit HflK
VDDILTTGRIALQGEILKTMQTEADELRLGVVIAAVALEEVQAPEEVRDAFLEVANAREDRNRIVQEAIGYSNEVLPRVRGRAQQRLELASIYRTEAVNRAHGEAERFRQVWEEYRKHREVTKARLLLETIDEVLPRIRKVILDEKGSEQGLDLDIFRVQP